MSLKVVVVVVVVLVVLVVVGTHSKKLEKSKNKGGAFSSNV